MKWQFEDIQHENKNLKEEMALQDKELHNSLKDKRLAEGRAIYYMNMSMRFKEKSFKKDQ